MDLKAYSVLDSCAIFSNRSTGTYLEVCLAGEVGSSTNGPCSRKARLEGSASLEVEGLHASCAHPNDSI